MTLNELLNRLVSDHSLQDVLGKFQEYVGLLDEKDRENIAYIFRGWRDAFQVIGRSDLADRVWELQNNYIRLTPDD